MDLYKEKSTSIQYGLSDMDSIIHGYEESMLEIAKIQTSCMVFIITKNVFWDVYVF